MRQSLSRRSFLAALPLAAAFADAPELKITAVEIWELRGHRNAVRGVDQQHQVNPLDIYEDLRQKPYRDGTPVTANATATALYLKIATAPGLEALYGPIDREVGIVVLEQLRPFLMGKDGLAQEKLWDQMYRSNRHARRGFLLMAISAVDNALWDLRGRYFKTPVYRLLGGPTRKTVEAYASCLGYSLEFDKAAGARGADQERRVSLSKMVSRLRSGRWAGRHEEERRFGARVARSRGRGRRADVRCI